MRRAATEHPARSWRLLREDGGHPRLDDRHGISADGRLHRLPRGIAAQGDRCTEDRIRPRIALVVIGDLATRRYARITRACKRSALVERNGVPHELRLVGAASGERVGEW